MYAYDHWLTFLDKTLSICGENDSFGRFPFSSTLSLEDLEILAALTFQLARRENVAIRVSSTQGSTNRLAKQMEPKELKTLRVIVVGWRMPLHNGSASSSDMSHHFPMILATVVWEMP